VTLKQTLSQAREILAAGNVEEPSLESELLLRYALELDRVQLYLELDNEPSPQQEATFWRLVERRRSGEPTAYITGHREFYGLDFHVDSGVLIPRPESELLVEKALELARHQTIITIAEIGTGCGAIAISLSLNLPRAKIYATDISDKALRVARHNCRKHEVTDRISLLRGDMLSPLPEPVDLIIANLPYVRDSELPRTGPLSFEPVLALNGGVEGLEKIKKLCRQAGGYLCPGGGMLLEVGQGQGQAIAASLQKLFPGAKVEATPDLSGIERVVNLLLAPEPTLIYSDGSVS